MASDTATAGPAAPATQRRLRPRAQLSDEVASLLRHKIMTAEYPPGRHIRMDETALALGVSVTPVREALLTLRGEGLVVLAPHRGYAVAELTRTDVEDMFWLQGMAAQRIARCTAGVVSPAQLAGLGDALAALRTAAAAGDPQAIAEAEFEFHRAHNRIAGCGKLAWFLLTMSRYTPHQLYAADPEWARTALDSHERLLSAYRERDGEAAATAVQRQFDDGAARLLRHLERAGIWA